MTSIVAMTMAFQVSLSQSYDLWTLAAQGNEEGVKAQLATGVNVNMQNEYGDTPLIRAVGRMNVATTRLLIAAGADLNIRNKNGMLAIHAPFRILRWKPPKERREIAQKYSDSIYAVITLLIEHGTDINAGDKSGYTLLHAASECSLFPLVVYLLQHGANVDARTSYGETPLMLAVQSSLSDSTTERIVDRLINAGADVNAKDRIGKSSLCKARFDKIVALLRAGGAHECDYIPKDYSEGRITPTRDPSAPYGIYIPIDLEDCFAELKRMFQPDRLNAIRSWDEDDMIMFHFGLGMYLRNNWGLWGGSRLQEYFFSLGVCHPDNMTGIIFTSFWRHLNGLPIKLDEQIDQYQKYEKEQSQSDAK